MYIWKWEIVQPFFIILYQVAYNYYRQSMIAEDQAITIKVDLKDNIEQLVNFSKKISFSCYQFTKKFVKTIHQLLQHNSMGIPNYLALIQQHFIYQKVTTPQTICARILVPGDYSFKCLQCQNEDNSVICIECFNKSNHQGHQYQKIQIDGGCCDCGDDQKWKVQGSCTDHMNKCVNIDVDKQKTDIFIQEMKYVLYLLYVLGLFPHSVPRHKQNITAYLQAFVKYLKNFNTSSMISNEMTYLLMKQKFNFPQLKTTKTYSLRITILQFLFRFYNEKQYCRILIDIFIIMFTRPQFRKYLTQQYNRLTSTKSLILLSKLSNISCQIYTSHRVISQLIEQNKFAPISVQPLDIGTRFETVADIYCRYYLDLVYLCNLYNGVGEVYSNFHMAQGNIVDICGYQKYVKSNPQQSVQYYGIQNILFIRYVQILKYAHKHHETTKKSIIDLVNSIKQTPVNQAISLYLTKQRTLILLLLILFNGNISKASNPKFLAQIGLDKETVHKILQQVLQLIKFYALNLANRQTVQRYYTFYSFSLNKRPRVIVSLDLQLLKFCICALQYLQYDHSFCNKCNVNVDYQRELLYQMEYMPVENLVTLPTQFIFKEFDKNMGDGNDEVYDRKKAITVLSDYIGILAQTILSNHSQLILRVTFGIGKTQQASLNKILQFYIQILSSFETLKIGEFKQICRIFIDEEKDVMQKFVREFCIIENTKIRLNPSKVSENKAINLGYLKTKKCCQPLIAHFASNSLKNGYDKKPLDAINIDNRNILINRLFPQLFITRICQIVNEYVEKMLHDPKILEKDMPHFSSFIQQLIFLHYTINSKPLQQAFTSILSTPQIISKLPQRLQKQLTCISGVKQNNLMGYNSQNKKMEQELDKKQKQQEIKNKKIQKLKSKQIKAIDSLKDQQKLMQEEQSQESLVNPICMFCRMGESQEPLSLLCFQQSSNLISRYYLNQYYPAAQLLTTCNHYAHNSCNLTVNHLKEYIHCNLCKNSCNRLIIIQTDKQLYAKQQKLQQTQEMQQMQQQHQAAIEQLKFTKFNGQQNKQKQQDNPTIPFKSEFSAIQTQIETIALSILYGAVGDFNFFNRSVSKVCCVLLRKLTKEQTNKKIHVNNLINLVNWAMEAKKDKSQEEEMYWRVYKFIILSICSLVAVQRQIDLKQNVRNIQQSLPKQIVTNLTQILTGVRSPQSLQALQKLKITTLKQLTLFPLPKILSELAVNIGKCPCCLTISNQIAMCLICGFKSCVGCKAASLRKHVKEIHGESSVFIRVDEGSPIYVSLRKNRYMQHLYLNFLGQSFSFLKIKESQKINYKLNHQAYSKVRDDITRFRIQQQIRYLQHTTGKVSLIQP